MIFKHLQIYLDNFTPIRPFHSSSFEHPHFHCTIHFHFILNRLSILLSRLYFVIDPSFCFHPELLFSVGDLATTLSPVLQPPF